MRLQARWRRLCFWWCLRSPWSPRPPARPPPTEALPTSDEAANCRCPRTNNKMPWKSGAAIHRAQPPTNCECHRQHCNRSNKRDTATGPTIQFKNIAKDEAALAPNLKLPTKEATTVLPATGIKKKRIPNIMPHQSSLQHNCHRQQR